MTTLRRPARDTALLVAFAAFVIFGLPDGAIGTVWPTQRSSLGMAVGNLAWVTGGVTVGYSLGSIASGHAAKRVTTSRVIVAGLGIGCFGLVAVGVVSSLSLLTLAAATAGLGAGLLDAAVNSWVAIRHSTRAMGLLHGFFGIGAVLGPPLAAGIVAVGATWRLVYIVIGGLQLLLAGVVWWRRNDFDVDVPVAEVSPDRAAPGSVQLGLMMAWFFVVTGIETTVGAWGYSLLVDERGLAAVSGAAWMAGFWALFTVGRFAMGALGDRLRPLPALYWSLALVGCGGLLIWLDPARLPTGIGLPVLGAGASLLFPMMVLLTPRWLGVDRAALATGYQFGAAAVGVVGFAFLVGALADTTGLWVVAPLLVVAAAAAAGILTGLSRLAVAGTA